ncbi:MAG: hypothetical protein ABI668_14615 [Sphingorhabdus sp.]
MNVDDEALAKKRFFLLGIIRLSGALMIAIGLAVIARGFLDLPKVAGYVIFVVGIVDFVAMPVVLSRAWKSPPAA